MNPTNTTSFIDQFTKTLLGQKEAFDFIKKHKLWIGFWQYGWVSRILIVAAILFGIKFISVFIDCLQALGSEETDSSILAMSTLAGNLVTESYAFLFTGGLKYVMILLLEVIIFHMCRRTLEILTGNAKDLTFNTFVQAQIRMFKVVIRCFILEMILTILIKIGFGIFGFLDFAEPLVIFLIQSYFLGFLIFDNYSEQFGYSIKASMKLGKEYIGVLLAAGLVLNVLLLIPAIGALIGPMIVAVAVTLVMYQIADLHLQPQANPATTLVADT